tara:strand:+ start:680 stop:982 length:303 start_codon:yes stop_codon:yes gene_type:complete
MNTSANIFTPRKLHVGIKVDVVLWCVAEQRYRAWRGTVTSVTDERVKVHYDDQPGMVSWEANLRIGRQSIVPVVEPPTVWAMDASEWPSLPHPALPPALC